MNLSRFVAVPAVVISCACAGDAAPDTHQDAHQDAPDSHASPTPSETSEELVFRTDPVTVEPGEERYLCFAKTWDDEVAIQPRHAGVRASYRVRTHARARDRRHDRV
jgi:hypothetical protein